MNIGFELETVTFASLLLALFTKSHDLKYGSRWKQVIIGDPDALQGRAGAKQYHTNIYSKLAPFNIMFFAVILLTLIFYRLSIKNRWKPLKIGEPGFHRGGAGEAYWQINISSELEPATFVILCLAMFTKSRDLKCGDAPGPYTVQTCKYASVQVWTIYMSHLISSLARFFQINLYFLNIFVILLK